MRSLILGTFAGLGLLALYFTTMTALSKSFAVAWDQFQNLWWLMIPIASAFGLQVGLFTRLHTQKRSLAASGSSATVSMLACCAHHATDALPFLGLSAASLFLASFQIPILAVSLVINLIGVAILWRRL